MVSIAVSKIGMTELIFVVPGMKVNGQYYRDVLLSQQMLPSIKHVASDTCVFQQDNAPSHRARTPLNSYSKKRQTSLVLISGHQTAQTWMQWIIKYGVLCSRECMSVWTVSMSWICASLTSRTGVSERYWRGHQQCWRKQLRACVHADGQHFEHLLRARVTNKSYGQIKYKYLKKALLYYWTCDFRRLKLSQGKVRTINRWGGISNHLSMAHLLSNISAKITGVGQLLLKLSLVVGWYPFLRQCN